MVGERNVETSGIEHSNLIVGDKLNATLTGKRMREDEEGERRTREQKLIQVRAISAN